MATAGPLTLAQDLSDGPCAEPLADFVVIRTEDVEADERNRLRPVDQSRALAIGMGMLRDGQDTPIVVSRLPGQGCWTLVVGGHRLAGARQVGIAELKAEIVGPNRDSRQLREARENLFRTDLSPIDRAKHIATLVQIRRAQAGPREASARDAKVKPHLMKAVAAEGGEIMETISMIYGWTDEVGAELGFTGRTIRNDLLLYRGIGEASIERLRVARHPILGNATQLRAIAKLGGDEQQRVVDLLTMTSPSPPKTAADAIARMRGSNRAIDPEAKRLSTFLSTFQRMGLAEKKGALAQLAGMLPAGFEIVEAGR